MLVDIDAMGSKMTLLDAYGKELRGGKPILEEIGVAGVRERYSSYPSQGLVPERLASIFQEADQGDILRQAELFEEMEEKDAHLGSVLQTRKLAVAGLEYGVSAASDDGKDAEIASFVKEVLFRMDNWDEALTDLLDAIGKGFSVAELMWDIEPSTNSVWIRQLRWRHQKMFTFLNPPASTFQKGTAMTPDSPRLLTDASPVYGEVLPPNKFVVHKYRSRSGTAPRAGLLRPCAYMYLFKNYTIKDWVIFNERFAMPMRVGKFGPGSSEADRRTLRNAVFNLGSDAAAVISDSTVIEILESQGKGASADVYEKLVDFCDRSISKAVLGQTLTTEQNMGTYATARVHQMVRQDLLEADAKALSRTINMQVIRPLVEFNFGAGKRLPRFTLQHEGKEDLRALAETYGILARDVGFDGIPASYIHERFGIPVPEGKNMNGGCG